jgi:hypothetical protein
MVGRDGFVFDVIADGRKQSAAMTELAKQVKEQRSHGRFPIGAGHSHQF